MSGTLLLGRIASGAATLWTAGSWARARLYRSGLLRQRRLRTRVISIGNLIWGGTGKTPVTIWLAGRLQASGLRVSILTRGYGRRSSEKVRLLPPGTLTVNASCEGDEVQLYLRNLRVAVGISASRYEAGRFLESQFPVDVHLLDDGFQHLSLARDLDLVLVDVCNPWGSRWGVPRLLREGASALRRAHVILLTRCELAEPSGCASPEELLKTLKKINSNAQYFTVRTRLLHFVDLAGKNRFSVEAFQARRPLAFCALGNPSCFLRMLEKAGIQAAAKKTFSDHHAYNSKDVELLNKMAQNHGADSLLTTEKDVVNFSGAPSFSVPLYWAAIEPQVDDEARLLAWIWERLGFPREPLPAASLSAGGTAQANFVARI